MPIAIRLLTPADRPRVGQGIHTLKAVVLLENHGAIRLARRVGAQRSAYRGGGLADFELPVSTAETRSERVEQMAGE